MRATIAALEAENQALQRSQGPRASPHADPTSVWSKKKDFWASDTESDSDEASGVVRRSGITSASAYLEATAKSEAEALTRRMTALATQNQRRARGNETSGVSGSGEFAPVGIAEAVAEVFGAAGRATAENIATTEANARGLQAALDQHFDGLFQASTHTHTHTHTHNTAL